MQHRCRPWANAGGSTMLQSREGHRDTQRYSIWTCHANKSVSQDSNIMNNINILQSQGEKQMTKWYIIKIEHIKKDGASIWDKRPQGSCADCGRYVRPTTWCIYWQLVLKALFWRHFLHPTDADCNQRIQSSTATYTCLVNYESNKWTEESQRYELCIFLKSCF